MKRWITSDWHLGEDRMKLMQRPFKFQMDMINFMIAKHNEVVSNEDMVIVVGDVCYQKTPEFLPYVEKFNGKKILIRGNHDRVFSDSKLGEYFDDVIAEGHGLHVNCGEENIPCYINHYPTRSLEAYFNLVGHIHGSWKCQLNMLNVGVDANHFAPHDLDVDIPFYFNAIKGFYDDDVWVGSHKSNSFYQGIRGKKGSYLDTLNSSK